MYANQRNSKLEAYSEAYFLFSFLSWQLTWQYMKSIIIHVKYLEYFQ